MGQSEIQQMISDVGLGQRAEQIIQLIQKCMRIEAFAEDEDNLPLGKSKIGGLPDMPADIGWPYLNDTPLTFLCQFNLDEIGSVRSDDLPKKGILYFFYDCQKQPWGYDPADRGSWKVIYYDGDLSELKRANMPKDGDAEPDDENVFQPCRVIFKEDLSIPESHHSAIDELFNDDEMDAYFKLLEMMHEDYDDEPNHRILGYPDPIQGNMRLECQLVTNGLYCGDGSGYEDPRRKVLERDTNDWLLLLQLDSDDGAGMMWGDCGRMYFWIRKQDLMIQNFDNVWMILQCY